MRLPANRTERLAWRKPLEDDWSAVPKAVWILAACFYIFFLLQLARTGDLPAYLDLVFVPIHEGGHLLFGFCGMFVMVAGGTLLQLAVPLMLAMYFAFQRQVQGTAFCVFFFFEQMLPISVYMADARAQELPLLTVGDSDDVIHDWNYLFGRLGLLEHDAQIAHVVRTIGWLGMLATVAWMIWRSALANQDTDGRRAEPAKL